MAVKRPIIQGSEVWVERQEKEEPKARSPITSKVVLYGLSVRNMDA
jgi:hypothetical protein